MLPARMAVASVLVGTATGAAGEYPVLVGFGSFCRLAAGVAAVSACYRVSELFFLPGLVATAIVLWSGGVGVPLRGAELRAGGGR